MLTAVGTGIGVLGFVMFFGGFILWTRFEAAGLPANEAVAKVPRSDLVATGASFLVPAILAALVTSAIALTGWDFAIGSRRRDLRKQAEDERLRATEILAGLEKEKSQLERRMQGCRTRAERQKRLGDEATPDSPERKSAREAQKAAEEEAEKCEERLQVLTDEEVPAQRAAQKKAAEAGKGKPTRRNRGERYLQVLIGLVPMLIAGGVVILAGWGGLSGYYQALLISVAVLTIVVAIVVVSMTEHFAWYMVCVFLSVGITIAFSTYARTQSHVKVSPVAALSDSSPVIGFFVAETSDAIYVGKPQPAETPERANSSGFEPDGVTLLRVPKDTLTGLTIGPIMGEKKGYRRSLQLAMALCRRSVATGQEAAKPPKAPGKSRRAAQQGGGSAKPAACSARERRLLRNRLETAP